MGQRTFVRGAKFSVVRESVPRLFGQDAVGILVWASNDARGDAEEEPEGVEQGHA
jgi:hypothetical protein